jgi:ABC-type branched-subunit amino acid transport system ATPase component
MSLRLEGLAAGYGREPIVHDVTLPVPDRCISVLIGPNGAGKSTILKALFGAANIMRGTIFIDEVYQPRITPAALLRHGIAYVPQLRNVFLSLSVLENLDMGLGGARKDSLDRVLALFPDLQPVLSTPARKLSGGQRNMLALGRALMGSPRTLLIDEGSAGLAPRVVQLYWKHLERLVELGVGVLVVEQDVHAALSHAERAHVLRGGEVVLTGSGSDLAARQDLGAIFLGAEARVNGKRGY